MTSEHLSETQTVDLALGEPVDSAVRAHAAACPACARPVADVRAGLELAGQGAWDDPDDAFWRTLRPSIVAAARAELASRRRRTYRLWSYAAAASILLSVAVWSPLGLRVSPTPSAAPAWVALPAVDEDAGWTVVEEIVPALPEDVWELGRPALADLSPAESEALVEALRAELEAGRKS